MEVVIGFAVGYWVGTRQGRQGLQNALESAQAIWAHPETRKMLAEGISAAQTVAGPAMERLGNPVVAEPPDRADQLGRGRAHRAAPGAPRGIGTTLR